MIFNKICYKLVKHEEKEAFLLVNIWMILEKSEISQRFLENQKYLILLLQFQFFFG